MCSGNLLFSLRASIKILKKKQSVIFWFLTLRAGADLNGLVN